MEDTIRFNESIDQIMTESISHYSLKRDRSRNLFIGIMSHDLLNPLSAAQMSAELTLKIGKNNLDERQTMLIKQVKECTARATEIVTYLLDLTRARMGSGLPIIVDQMDMGFVSKQLVDEMRTRHPSYRFNLDLSGDLNGSWDKTRVGQVFSNLLSNAVQYGFKNADINVKVEGLPSEVVISVQNEGVPIPPGETERIFDSLTRGESDDTGEHPGAMNLGLGLYITKEIIIAHGGAINVISNEKKVPSLPRRFHVHDRGST